MTLTTYHNFDLLLTRAGARYKAIVVDAPAGEESVLFDPPFAAGALPRLEGLARGVTRGSARSAARAIGVADDPGPAADLAEVGSRLFAAVFAGPVGTLLAASQASVAAEDAGLRLRLRFEADAAELALLPWETLYDPAQGHFVGLGEASPVLRYLALPRSRSALPVKPPLRVLAVLASPASLPALDVEREWQAIQEALADLVADGKFVLERLVSPTLDALQQRLLGEPVHILHFIGHGVFDEAGQAGALAFADARGRPHLVRGDDLAKLLRNHPAVRLAYLNACEGALAAGGSVFTGVAQALVREGAPAAVAMQAEISDPGAIELARTFYSALAAGRPVDAALTQARVALSAAGSQEWAIPVLFSRSPDNRLFDIRQVLPTPDCPYPGMVPFSEAQRELFFGRDREIEEATARLRQHPFLAVIGASGSGKSSLINAGVIPALRKSRRSGADEWEIKTMRPSDRRTPSGQAAPMQALAELLDLAPDGQLPNLPLSPSPHLPSSTLLFVDQFEELFTLAAVDEAQAFLTALGALSGRPNLAILLTARADFYPELMACTLWPAIKGNRLELPPLGDDELWAAIVEPANRVGVTVDEALAVKLIADASGQKGVLPLVQETLVLLWDKVAERQLGLKAYQAMAQDGRSGLQVAIDRRASIVYDNLPAAAQAIARRIFLRLVQFGEGRADTRRQQTAAELRASDDDPALFEQTLAQLTASRLLTASGEAGDPNRRIDIAHEALIAGWPRLQEWLNQRRAAEGTRRRLEGKATEWVAAEKRGGLLDEYELQEAEGWLAGEDAGELGVSQALLDLVTVSRETLTQIAAEKEAQRQRELGQAQKLAEEQRLRAEEGEKSARGLRKRLILAATIGVVALTLGVIALWFAVQSQNSEKKAQLEAQRARSNELAANAQVELAQTPPDHSLALLLATESSKIRQADSESAVFPASFRALVESVVAAPDYRLSLPPHLHSGAINSIAFSPQCLRPAPSEGRPCPRALLTTGDETARLWDSETMQQLGQPLGHSSEVFYAQFSFDGSRILTQDMDGTLYVWKVSEDGRLLQKINPAKLSLAVGLTPDGQEVMAVPAEGVTRVWSVATGRETRQIRAAADAWRAIFSPDWRTLAVVTDHDVTVVVLIDVASGAVRATLPIGHEVAKLDFLSNEQLVVQSIENLDFETETSLWDVGDGHRLPAPPIAALSERLPGDFMATQFILPSGETVRFEDDTDTSSPDSAATPWSGITLSGMESLLGHLSATALNSDPTGTLIVAGGERGNIMAWELPSVYSMVSPTASTGPVGGISAMAFGAQGKRILTGGGGGGLDLWDAATGERLLALPPQPWSEWIDQVALSDDGSLAAALSHNLGLGVWDTRTEQPLPGRTFTEDDWPARILFIPSGADLLGPPSETPRLLVLGADTGRVYLYDPLSGAIRRPFEDDCETHTHMALSQDGGTLVLACEEGKIRVWRAGADAPTLDGVPPRAIMALYADGADGSFRVLFRDGDIWDSRRGRDNYQRPNTGLASAESAAFSPNGRQLMLTAGDQMRLVDVKSGETLLNWRHRPQGTYSGGTTADFSPDGQTIATLGLDARIRLWAVGPGARKYLTSSELPAVLPASYCATPDHADCLTIIGRFWTPRWGIPVWETSAGQAAAVAQMPISPTLGVTPDGSYAVIRAADNRLCVWDVAAAQETSCLSSEQNPQRIWEMAIGNTEPTLATWDERELRLWRLPDLEPGLSVPVGGTMGDGNPRLAFSPKAPILAVVGNNEVTLWDVGGRKAVRLQSLPSPQGDIKALTFSSDGSAFWLASGGQASSIISRWRTDTWQEASAPRLQVDTGITALAVSPKGDRLAAGGADGMIYLWDTTTGNEIGRLESNGVAALNFNGDGRVLFSAGVKAISVQIWPVDGQDLQDQASRLISRDPPQFTGAELRRYGLK